MKRLIKFIRMWINQISACWEASGEPLALYFWWDGKNDKTYEALREEIKILIEKYKEPDEKVTWKKNNKTL